VVVKVGAVACGVAFCVGLFGFFLGFHLKQVYNSLLQFMLGFFPGFFT
jgi:hypothetical protein